MAGVGEGASFIGGFIRAINTLSRETNDETWKEEADNKTLSEKNSNTKKSLYIDLGWTFSLGRPSGKYVLKLNGDQYTGVFSDGRIEIRNQLDSVTGKGELIIKLQDSNGNATGPSFRSEIELDLPPVQTQVGLARRLTNLGFYAGTDGTFDGRMQWAVRAFKRARMNGFERNRTEPENNNITQAFLSAVHREYGAHSGDSIPANGLSFSEVTRESSYCGMFGSRTYCRNSFQTRNAPNDHDPQPGQAGIWEGVALTRVEDGVTKATVEDEPIVGNFKIYLRAFDPSENEDEIRNRINLPQPIHMAQFVLFELGYWLVGGEVNDNNSRIFGATRTRNSFTPDGIFGRYTQWAVREFQCHAKFPNAAKEDVASTEQRYLPRLFRLSQNPPSLTGIARYPDNGRISGALNEDVRNALQAWADGALRCPVIVYASTDNGNSDVLQNGINLDRIVQENLWLYNDHRTTAPRMYAIDYSGYYTIPERYRGQVSYGGYTFPRPIVVGTYTNALHTGIYSLPPSHTWGSADVEIRPDIMLGTGGNNGVGLTDSQLSTFKVIRTASHFECYGYFDCLNAYDRVTLSFGPCHWTLQDCDGINRADNPREMPAFLAYMRHTYPNDYRIYFGIFGFTPQREWPIPLSDSGTYCDRLTFETEDNNILLCGFVADGHGENKYLKNWHSYYRFLMATRLSTNLRRAMWDFTRIRIRDILNRTFVINGRNVRVGNYVTSEKGVAMLLRWHIYGPNHVYEDGNLLWIILDNIIKDYPEANQVRENEILRQLSNIGGPPTNGNLTVIYGWTNVPQQGLRNYYRLNLTNPTLSSQLGSFQFEAPQINPIV